MFGSLARSCPRCGLLIGDDEVHQQFHDALGLVWQKVFDIDDETAERITGVPAAERNARLAALAEALGIADG